MPKYNRIIFTGSTGRFGRVFRKFNNKKKYFYPEKKELDITNINSIRECFNKIKPDLIIHCAALSRPMEIHEKKPAKSISINIIGTANLVNECIKRNIKIIYFSTSYVYEGSVGNYKETDPVKPFNNYGLSKLGGECSVMMYKNSLILRITMTEEPFMFKYAYDNLIANYIYHEDLVKILPKIINQKGIINIGGKAQSIYNFAKSKQLNVKKIKLIKTKKLPLRQDMSILKLNKILNS